MHYSVKQTLQCTQRLKTKKGVFHILIQRQSSVKVSTANSNWQTTELSTALVYFKTSQTVKIYKLKKAREVYIVNNKHVSSDPSGSAI